MPEKTKMPGHCSTAPRGQGQFHYGNSTGTASTSGPWKIFVLEFGTKSCLRVWKDLLLLQIMSKLSAEA